MDRNKRDIDDCHWTKGCSGRLEYRSGGSYCPVCKIGGDFDTTLEDRITCPFCGEQDCEYTDYPRELKRDGDHTPYECGSCEKNFMVTLSVSYSYSSSKI